MASVIDICNLALSWLGSDKIASFDDQVAEAGLCATNYPLSRNAVLEAYDWSFATKRLVLAPQAAAPAFGPSYSFLLPPEVLRLISVSNSTKLEDKNNIDWELERRAILCDEKVVYIKYVTIVTDTTKFSPLFVEALAARIAADLAVPIVSSNKLQASMWELYGAKISEASNSDAMQMPRQSIKSDRLTRVR